MQLYIIGPKRGGEPHAIGLAESAEEKLKELAAANVSIPSMTLQRAIDLPPGVDRMVAHSVAHQLRGRAMTVTPWFKVTAGKAIEAADLAQRAGLDDRRPPKPDYATFMRYLRGSIFDTTQEVMAAIAGVNHSTYSRWEKGSADPGVAELHRIGSKALALGLPWQAEWLFMPPTDEGA